MFQTACAGSDEAEVQGRLLPSCCVCRCIARHVHYPERVALDLVQVSSDANFFIGCFGREVDVNAVLEQRVGLLAGHQCAMANVETCGDVRVSVRNGVE